MADEKKAVEPDCQLNPPAWLDAALVEKTLLGGGEGNLKVSSLTVRPATAPGDNYSSTIYRLTATLSEGGERSFIVKTLPPMGEEILQTIRETHIFHRETTMLAHVIPRLEVLLEEVAPGRFPHLAARCPHHGSSPDDFLVLEDLTPQGFKCADRHKGLGLRHCLLALRALGRYHAASVAMLERDPRDVVEELNKGWVITHPHAAFVSSTFSSAIEACRSWPGFEEVADRLEAFKPIAAKTFLELQEPSPGKLNVIIHGDFWTNNMMFRSEDGRPDDVRFVDLQISHVASPVMDVIYFLTTSPSESVSTHYEDLLVREYHNSLSDAMQLLGLQAPTLEALQSEIDRHGAFALFGTVCVLPIVKAVKALDMEGTLSGEGDVGNYMYRSPTVTKWLQRVLPEYCRKGWLPR